MKPQITLSGYFKAFNNSLHVLYCTVHIHTNQSKYNLDKFEILEGYTKRIVIKSEETLMSLYDAKSFKACELQIGMYIYLYD